MSTRHPKLGPSELRTLHALRAQGWGYRRIAHVLAVHWLTVKYHVKQADRKGIDRTPSCWRCPGCGGRATAPEGHASCHPNTEAA